VRSFVVNAIRIHFFSVQGLWVHWIARIVPL
jgi:hypothetical protein